MIPELGNDVPEDAKEKLRHNPRIWVRNSLKHPIDPSRPYDFKTADGNPLSHLLHEDSWLNPETWADINILLLARGELKSTTTGWITTWAHDAFPQFHTYMIAPNTGQVKDYLDPIRETYVEQADMDGRRKTNNKTKQVFKTYVDHGNGDPDPVMGRIQTDSGYSEESVRGKHSQMGVFDETQDLTQRVFNVALPSIDQTLPDNDWFPTVFCIGTPKETGSFYQDLWERSDKRTWDAEAGEWNIQEAVDPYELSAEDIADIEDQIDTDLDLDDLDDGESYTVRGWHVDWINSPLHSMADVARAKQQMGPMEFQNEVLAQFYEPEDNLLSDQTVTAAFTPEYDFRESPYNEDNTTAVVADWGGGTDQNASDTVILAVEEVTYENDEPEYVLLDITFLDPGTKNRDEIRTYEEWLLRYDADVGLVDYGFGEQAMESLQHGYDTIDPDGYMDTVSAVHYGNVSDRTDIKWTTDDDGNRTFFTCAKSRTATRMVESFRDEQWVIPEATPDSTGLDTQTSGSDGITLIEQLTAPYKTLAETTTGKKRVDIETPGNQRDDAFDVLSYCWLALNEVADEDESVLDIQTNTRRGLA